MLPQTLASIRTVYPDCVVELGPYCAKDDDRGEKDHGTSDADVGSAVIVGHRAVLSKLPYFAALFARADPVRVDRGGLEGAQRPFRLVYRACLPFQRNSLDFLVNLLYGTAKHFGIVSKCDDPVDVIGAAIYLGFDTRDVETLVEVLAATLLKNLGRLRSGGDNDCGGNDAYQQLAAFVLHMTDSGLPDTIKRTVLGRMFGFLNSADRLKIHSSLVPADYYRPDAVGVGAVNVDSNGIRWREITLACDQYTGGWGAEVIHQGLVFRAKASCGPCFEDEDVTVSISVTPEGETLGVWQRSEMAPDGAINVVPRAMTARIDAYHPIACIPACERTLWSWSVRDTPASAAHLAYPKDAVFVPCGFSKTAKDGRTAARRRPFGVTIEGPFERYQRAVACVVHIQVKEQTTLIP